MKKPTRKQKKQPLPLTKKIVVSAGIAALTACIVILAVHNYGVSVDAKRLARINAIYAGLRLSEKYHLQSANVFGDKRPYDWGGDAGRGRTYSSSMTYQVGMTRDAAFADVESKVTAEGFSFIGEPYPGSTSLQKHYRNSKGEYVRLTVSSKPRDDALRDASLLGQNTAAAAALDPNAAPSNVLIKVNLDDNNE